ncbi:hypothetical protein E2C01_070261 [Portunus trituberculatus]|uniref:Uncharacterized protein n=1 Tax=Portunus trituberculatus TaxID=210409 RepID=A0A5B7I4Y1_PORTR|nr:hypothetical protein [Portunus trituberculatus]
MVWVVLLFIPYFFVLSGSVGGCLVVRRARELLGYFQGSYYLLRCSSSPFPVLAVLAAEAPRAAVLFVALSFFASKMLPTAPCFPALVDERLNLNERPTTEEDPEREGI